MVVNEYDASNFCFVLPPKDIKQTTLDKLELEGLYALQIGWPESIPSFVHQQRQQGSCCSLYG